MKKYILALDEGTTSARSILFDREMNIVSVGQNEIRQIYPQPGWVEQEPNDIYHSQHVSMKECVRKAGIDPREIAAIAITNQRETTIVWDKETGKPVSNAIVWQCRRTADICDKLLADGLGDTISGITGLKPDAYFSGTKIRWILDNVPGAREKAEAGKLLFGTVDTWLMWRLSGGTLHLTDRTNASRTMLYNLSTGDWDEQMLKILDIPRSMLPGIQDSGSVFGEITFMDTKIPICGVAGDQQAALFGQHCFHPGEMKNTYGTGCFLLANTGREIVRSAHGLVATAAANLQGEPMEYALEGSVFVGGAVIQWLRDELRMFDASCDCDYFAAKVPDSGGVYIVPSFTGMGAPYWDMRARGAIFGLTRGSNRFHIMHAALDSIVYQTEDVIRSVAADTGKLPSVLRVDGGASVNDSMMQFQADISGITVERGGMKEATARGAAYLAGLTAGLYANRASLPEDSCGQSVFTPSMDDSRRTELLGGWHRAVAACRNF